MEGQWQAQQRAAVEAVTAQMDALKALYKDQDAVQAQYLEKVRPP